MMAKKKQQEIEDLFNNIDDYNHIGSSIGNAYFSGLTMEELWGCVLESSNREELDFAVSATIWLKELVLKKKNDEY
jgi:hypothetical protein